MHRVVGRGAGARGAPDRARWADSHRVECGAAPNAHSLTLPLARRETTGPDGLLSRSPRAAPYPTRHRPADCTATAPSPPQLPALGDRPHQPQNYGIEGDLRLPPSPGGVLSDFTEFFPIFTDPSRKRKQESGYDTGWDFGISGPQPTGSVPSPAAGRSLLPARQPAIGRGAIFAPTLYSGNRCLGKLPFQEILRRFRQLPRDRPLGSGEPVSCTRHPASIASLPKLRVNPDSSMAPTRDRASGWLGVVLLVIAAD